MNPSPESIINARHAAGLTQAASAKLVHVSRRAWLWWEQGGRAMPCSTWELFLLKAFDPYALCILTELRDKHTQTKADLGDRPPITPS